MKRCVACSHRADYHNAFGVMPCAVCDCARLRMEEPSRQVKKPAPPKPFVPVKPERWLADARAIRRHAAETVRQCDHYLHNGHGDEVRFLFIHLEAKKAAQRALVASERYGRESDARPANSELGTRNSAL